jgi:hypothetical protein
LLTEFKLKQRDEAALDQCSSTGPRPNLANGASQMAKANNKLSRFAKRHYEAIAEAMQKAYGNIDHDGPASDLVRAGINKARAELANTFARDNGSFDRDRFERACVPGANVRARSSSQGWSCDEAL